MSRREELLDATAAYLLRHGMTDVSLRPLAAAVGSKARLLIYHFGSRERLLNEGLALVLRRVQSEFLTLDKNATLDAAILAFWRDAISPERAPYLKLIFEVHGLAPRQARLLGRYARTAIESWRDLIAERLPARLGHADRAARATLMVSVVNGLLLDVLATGDGARATRALRQFLKFLAREGSHA
jgi:AcrR family transcriptional regulator